MTITGTPRFDSLVIATMEADFRNPTTAFTARAAFVNTKDGATHGWTDASGSVWSKQTMGKLKELRESMERDLGKLHLEGVAAAKKDEGLSLEDDGGVGEYIEGSSVPSV
jgi:hypothetical protein